MSSMAFDLMTLNLINFIGSAIFTHVLSLMVICLSVLMITQSQAIFAYMSPHDLRPLTSWPQKLISSLALHTCPDFDGNPSIGSNGNVITSYLCLHNEPCDLWPRDPKFYSVHQLCKIHTWPKFGGNPLISYWENLITRTGHTDGRTTKCDLIESPIEAETQY